jgi:ketosteroid isomerase-like protein
MTSIDSFLAEWAGAERDGDTGTLEALLTGDFIGVGPLGFMLPKPAWLARHGQGGLAYDEFGLDEVRTRHLGGDAAVVTARENVRGSYQGNPVPEAVRATLVLVEEAGQWKLAVIHMSFVAGTAGAPPIPGPGRQ